MGIININALIVNKTFHTSPISITINCDKGQYQVLGEGIFVIQPGVIPKKGGGYYSVGERLTQPQPQYAQAYKKLLNIQYKRISYWFDVTQDQIREACRDQGTSSFTDVIDNKDGSFTAKMPNSTETTWSEGDGRGFDGFVDDYSQLPAATSHKDETWYVINTTIPGALGNVWRSDGNDWISSLTLLKTKGDLLSFSTEQDILPLGTNGFVLIVDTTEPTGLKYVPFTPLPVSLGTPNQILGMNNAGTALEYKTVSTSGTAVANDVGVTLTTPNQLVINLPSASATVRGVLTAADWTTFNSKLTSTLSNTKIFIGSAGNVATEQTLSLSASGGSFALAANGVLTMPNADTSTRGLLTSTDWNTFNNKLTSTLSNTKIFIGSAGNVATEQILSLNATGGSFALAASGVLTMPNADTSTRGLLTSTDWNTFNSKESALTFSTGLTRTVNTITANLSTGVAGGQTAIGGTGTTDKLSIKATTGNGTLTSVGIDFLVGNNGTTTAASILNSGFWGYGTTSPLTVIHAASTLTTSPRGISSSQHSTSTDGARVNVYKSRGTNSSPTIITSGDNIGRLHGYAYDGTSYIEAVSILYNTEGTIGTNRIPTNMIFYTNTDAATSVLTEVMRMDSLQNVAIGTGSAANVRLKVQGSTEQLRVLFNSSNYWSTTISTSSVLFSTVGAGTVFQFSSNIGIGTASASYPITITSTTNAGTINTAGEGDFLASINSAGFLSGKTATATNLAIGTAGSNKDILILGWNGLTNLERVRFASGGKTGFGTGSTVSALIHGISTTEQLRVGYDANYYWKTTVASDGNTTLALAATVGVPRFIYSNGITLSQGTSTANTAPLKFISGTLLGTAVAGAVEFLTDKFYGTITTGAARKEFIMGDNAITDGVNIVVGTGTGTQIGSSSSQKIGFYGATPVARPNVGGTPAILVGGGGTNITDTDTFDGYTLKEFIYAVRATLGLLT